MAMFVSGQGEIVKLIIAGNQFTGWEDVSITRSLENACSSFSLSASVPFQDLKPITIPPGATCQVQITNDLVLTGFVDSVDVEYSATTHTMHISGRSKTEDIVDCSQQHTTGGFFNITLLQMAQQLCQPYGVTVICDPTLASDPALFFKGYQAEIGESVYDALERAARVAQVLITDNELGQLVITRVNKTSGGVLKCKYGGTDNNILTARSSSNYAERFSSYRVRTQAAGTDQMFGDAANSLEATTLDPAITRNRVNISILSYGGTTADAAKHGQWLAASKGGKGTVYAVSVPGWRNSDGNLWQSNTIVQIDDDFSNIHSSMTVGSVTYTMNSAGGTITQMTLNPSQAFIPDTTYRDPRLAAFAATFGPQ
jgi:prophage tail gpP-like protein